VWRPSVIDWQNNAWYWHDCVQHSSLFILPETVELYSSEDWQLLSIDVFQPGVNVKLNAIFCLLWRVTSCWWWGAPYLPNLFSESVLNSAVRGQGSTSILKHLRRREQISRGNANPIDLQSLHGGSWLGRYRIRRRGLVRRSQGGSTYGDDIKLAGKLSVIREHQNCRRNMRKLYSTTNCSGDFNSYYDKKAWFLFH